ncbi:hypothetical protein SNS2_1172 [Streptomyces netropsis]|nr:hypothetical protein SNS2_1172 [Streptomyces netropsis]
MSADWKSTPVILQSVKVTPYSCEAARVRNLGTDGGGLQLGYTRDVTCQLGGLALDLRAGGGRVLPRTRFTVGDEPVTKPLPSHRPMPEAFIER